MRMFPIRNALARLLIACLLPGALLAAEPTVQDGITAFLRAEFDRAAEIWRPLAAAGDTEAIEGLKLLDEMDHEARLQFIDMGVAQALGRQDFAEIERLWMEAEKLALTWPDEPPGRRAALQAQLQGDLAAVRKARSDLTRIDAEIARAQTPGSTEIMVCKTSLTRQPDDQIKTFGGCPEGVPADLAAKHRADLEAAIANFGVDARTEFLEVETTAEGSRGIEIKR